MLVLEYSFGFVGTARSLEGVCSLFLIQFGFNSTAYNKSMRASIDGSQVYRCSGVFHEGTSSLPPQRGDRCQTADEDHHSLPPVTGGRRWQQPGSPVVILGFQRNRHSEGRCFVLQEPVQPWWCLLLRFVAAVVGIPAGSCGAVAPCSQGSTATVLLPPFLVGGGGAAATELHRGDAGPLDGTRGPVKGGHQDRLEGAELGTGTARIVEARQPVGRRHPVLDRRLENLVLLAPNAASRHRPAPRRHRVRRTPRASCPACAAVRRDRFRRRRPFGNHHRRPFYNHHRRPFGNHHRPVGCDSRHRR